MPKLAPAAVLALLVGVPGWVAAEETEPDGKSIFLTSGCKMCHSVPSQGIVAKATSKRMKGPDIAGITAEPSQLGRYLRGQTEKNGVPHMKAFKGTAEQLELLVAWVLDQK
jgi:hypothetical protein